MAGTGFRKKCILLAVLAGVVLMSVFATAIGSMRGAQTGAGLVLLAAGVGGVAALLLGAQLVRELRRNLGADSALLAEVARALARGGLGASDALVHSRSGIIVNSKESSRSASLARALQEIDAGMQCLVEEMHGNAAQLTRAAATLASSTAQVASGSEVQAAAAAGMAVSVGQMAASISQGCVYSHTAMRVSRESGDLSAEASSVVSGASEELESVANSAREFSGIIQMLGQRSSRISSIVSVIQDIANQTNLLALNAAIEAARAGEQGRGFSVVADEVRKLADRTTASTREISSMILSIQEGTGQAVDHMEKWGVRVSGGVSRAQGAGARIEQVRNGALEVIEAVDRVSDALAEQSSASEEIAAAVGRIATASQQGRESAGAMSNSAEVVARLAAALSALAGRYQPKSIQT